MNPVVFLSKRARHGRRVTIDDILLASYRRFTRDQYTRQAVICYVDSLGRSRGENSVGNSGLFLSEKEGSEIVVPKPTLIGALAFSRASATIAETNY
jgi:hypothetical protein